MKYAIVQSGGKQYKAIVGEEILVDKLTQKEGDVVDFDTVLLVRDESEIKIGTPNVDGSKVKGTVVAQVKGDKVITAKFKAKVNYRRKIGFRAKLTRVRIESIGISGKSTESSVKKEKTKTQ